MLPGALRLQISLTKDQTKTQTWSLQSLRRWLVTTACLQTKTDHQDDGNGRGEMGGELARGLGLVTNVIWVGVVGSEKLVRSLQLSAAACRSFQGRRESADPAAHSSAAGKCVQQAPGLILINIAALTTKVKSQGSQRPSPSPFCTLCNVSPGKIFT